MAKKQLSLDGLSVSDLTALQAQIDQQIKVKHEETRQEVKEQILALLAESGFSVADIFPSARKPEASPASKKVKVSIPTAEIIGQGAGKCRCGLNRIFKAAAISSRLPSGNNFSGTAESIRKTLNFLRTSGLMHTRKDCFTVPLHQPFLPPAAL